MLGSSNLMCFFHVKHAARDYFFKHFKGTKEEKDQRWTTASSDIDLLRGAHTEPDFQSRCSAIRDKWAKEGLEAATAWSDKSGGDHDFVAYFFKQWLEQVPDWYLGASKGTMAPGTNNGAESCIKNVRFDAGNVIGGVGETLAFVLEQVKTVSNCDFDAEAVRKTERMLSGAGQLLSGVCLALTRSGLWPMAVWSITAAAPVQNQTTTMSATEAPSARSMQPIWFSYLQHSGRAHRPAQRNLSSSAVVLALVRLASKMAGLSARARHFVHIGGVSTHWVLSCTWAWLSCQRDLMTHRCRLPCVGATSPKRQVGVLFL